MLPGNEKRPEMIGAFLFVYQLSCDALRPLCDAERHELPSFERTCSRKGQYSRRRFVV